MLTWLYRIPLELTYLCDELGSSGYSVFAPVLSGHGVDVPTLAETRAADWLSSAEAALHRLTARNHHRRVTVVGFSMGGLLALQLAKRFPACVQAIALINVPIWLKPSERAGIYGLAALSRLLGHPESLVKKNGPDLADPQAKATLRTLPAMPILALASMLNLMRQSRAVLPKIHCPAFVANAVNDRTVPFSDGAWLAKNLASKTKDVHHLENGSHIAGLDHDKEHLGSALLAFVSAQYPLIDQDSRAV